MTTYPNDQGNASGAIPVWVANPANGNFIKPNSDGSINVSGVSFDGNLTVDSGGTSTALDPSYAEGNQSAPLSLDLTGHLRVRGPLAGNRTTGQLTIEDTPTKIFDVDQYSLGRTLTNIGNVTVFLGNATVSPTTGDALLPNTFWSEEDCTADLYGVTDTGNVTVTFMGKDQ